MNNLISASKLSFLSINKYHHDLHNFFDASSSPRPHFCMAILKKGCAEFHDCDRDKTINVKVGDIIFVVQGCCYTSDWHGSPEVEYISIHFSFEQSTTFPKGGKFFLQKIDSARLPPDIGQNYEDMLRSCNDGGTPFETLECFYKILRNVVPLLKSKPTVYDSRITSAIEYIEQNYQMPLTVDELASHSNMSASRFFPCFKKEVGMTPFEYINRYRVNRAILLLISDSRLSVEDISERTGFESSSYFRRVFKKTTGMSPREYRSSAVEI